MRTFYGIFFFTILTNLTANTQTFSLLKDINTGASESATLMISVAAKEKIIYSIVDQNGKTVLQKNSTLDKGSNSILVETKSLAAGLYTVSLHGQYTNTTMKFVKQ